MAAISHSDLHLYGKGFDVYAARNTKSAGIEDVADDRDQIEEALDDMIHELETLPGSRKGLPASQFSVDDPYSGLKNQSRVVVLVPGQEVDIPTIQTLNDLLTVEGKLLNKLQKEAIPEVLRASREEESDDEAEKRDGVVFDRLNALQQAIKSKTDQICERHDIKIDSGGSAETARVFPERAQRLLEQFFAHCHKPNDSEMWMLAGYLGQDVWGIYDWFKAKGAETAAIHLMMANGLSNHPTYREDSWNRVRDAMVRRQSELDWAANNRDRHKKAKEEMEKLWNGELNMSMEVDEMD